MITYMYNCLVLFIFIHIALLFTRAFLLLTFGFKLKEQFTCLMMIVDESRSFCRLSNLSSQFVGVSDALICSKMVQSPP